MDISDVTRLHGPWTFRWSRPCNRGDEADISERFLQVDCRLRLIASVVTHHYPLYPEST